jgi:Na+/H+ antiporter
VRESYKRVAEYIPTAMLVVALVAATTLIAEHITAPAPVLQTAVGVLLAFLPAFPNIQLEPRLVLLGVLPPLVYAAAVRLPWRDFRKNLRPISGMAIGLVACTTLVTAFVAHVLIPGLSWSAAFVLGAIISPTDPVAATAVASRLGVPKRLTTIIEGEGLVNDAIALTIFGIASSAMLGGGFSIETGLLKFAVIVVGEIAYGVLVGWGVAHIRRRVSDARVEIAISLLTPFLAYLPPESLGGSGVLAVVSAGMYIGELTPELVPSTTRLHLTGVWDFIIYSLNGALFLLTGLQLAAERPEVLGLQSPAVWRWGAAISAAMIAMRFLWTWTYAWAPYALDRATGRNASPPSHRRLAFIAWSGIRGGISLAAALSISTAARSRPLILFLASCAIAATLLVQGVTLPYVIRLLRLNTEAEEERKRLRAQEIEARIAAARAAIETIRSAGPPAEHLLRFYEHRSEHLRDLKREEAPGRDAAPGLEVELQKRAIAAERRSVFDLYRRGEISDEALRRVERELDLTEAQLTEGALAME